MAAGMYAIDLSILRRPLTRVGVHLFVVHAASRHGVHWDAVSRKRRKMGSRSNLELGGCIGGHDRELRGISVERRFDSVVQGAENSKGRGRCESAGATIIGRLNSSGAEYRDDGEACSMSERILCADLLLLFACMGS